MLIDTKKSKDATQHDDQNVINELSAKANIRDPKTEMVLKASGNSWVEIENIDGTIYCKTYGAKPNILSQKSKV